MAKKKKQKQPITSIPQEFKDRLETMFGPSVCRSFESTFVERPTTFRVNTIKADKAEVLRELSQAGFGTHKVPWYSDAFILRGKTKRELTELSMYSEGKIYIQSLASMVPPLVLDPQPGERILDLTAAPGSKTSQIAAMMQTQGELVANDNNKVRFFKLKHNMEQLGVATEREGWTFTLRLEHGTGLCKEYPEYFDKILLDAPCSAEARFVEGKPKSFGFWKERKIKEMAYKQRQLLFSAWNALKPGGTLVYSTCTFAPEENEVQISRLLERNDDVEVLPVAIDGLKSLPCITEWKNKTLHTGVKQTLRIKPDDTIEGFYIAKLKKPSLE
jgi:16S rRNA (cytosine1407-C5)-methyltransferase